MHEKEIPCNYSVFTKNLFFQDKNHSTWKPERTHQLYMINSFVRRHGIDIDNEKPWNPIHISPLNNKCNSHLTSLNKGVKRFNQHSVHFYLQKLINQSKPLSECLCCVHMWCITQPSFNSNLCKWGISVFFWH